MLQDALSAAIGRGGAEVERLSHSNTSVAFVVRGGAAVTLLLDRTPPAVVPGGNAEITILLEAGVAGAFAAGRLPMTQAVLTGAAKAAGPVRRYLEVDPILRRLLDDGGTGVPSWGVAREAPSDLLALETRGLHKSFDGRPVLRGIDLRVPEGTISVVLGPSGTGKSVLLQLVIGLLAPDAGEVYIRGRRLSNLSRSEINRLRRDIGVMYQDGALFSGLNVFDNVALPLRQHTDFEEVEVTDLVREQLAAVGLTDAAARMPGQLSGGMRKRAGLARALILSPTLVLCDEPDSGLDPVRTSLIGELLAEQHSRFGGTMVVVTHDVPLARLIADHVTVLWQGRVLEDGLANAVFASETPFVRQFLAGETSGPLGMDDAPSSPKRASAD